MARTPQQVEQLRDWREERLAARDRVEAFLQRHKANGAGTGVIGRLYPAVGHDSPAQLLADDLWILLGAHDSVLAAAGSVGHPLRDRLTEAIRRSQVDPQAIADTALRVVGRAIGGAR